MLVKLRHLLASIHWKERLPVQKRIKDMAPSRVEKEKEKNAPQPVIVGRVHEVLPQALLGLDHEVQERQPRRVRLRLLPHPNTPKANQRNFPLDVDVRPRSLTSCPPGPAKFH